MASGVASGVRFWRGRSPNWRLVPCWRLPQPPVRHPDFPPSARPPERRRPPEQRRPVPRQRGRRPPERSRGSCSRPPGGPVPAPRSDPRLGPQLGPWSGPPPDRLRPDRLRPGRLGSGSLVAGGRRARGRERRRRRRVRGVRGGPRGLLDRFLGRFLDGVMLRCGLAAVRAPDRGHGGRPERSAGRRGQLGFRQRQPARVVVGGRHVPTPRVEQPLGDVQAAAGPERQLHLPAPVTVLARVPLRVVRIGPQLGEALGHHLAQTGTGRGVSLAAHGRVLRLLGHITTLGEDGALEPADSVRPGFPPRPRSLRLSPRRGFVPGSPWVARDSPLRSHTGRAARTDPVRLPAVGRRWAA